MQELSEHPLTLFIIIVTSLISYMGFSNRELFDKLKFNPYLVVHKQEYGRMFSHGLLHSGWTHLLINMFVLYSFGGQIEMMFQIISSHGKTLYVLMYVLAFAAASIPALFKYRNLHYYNAVGASGAVSAVVFAGILIMPMSRISFIFLPFIRIPAVIFGLAYLLYSYYMAKRGADNVAHEAHFAGAVFGFIFPLIIEPRLFSNFMIQIFS